jgi:hypothetical protein
MNGAKKKNEAGRTTHSRTGSKNGRMRDVVQDDNRGVMLI